MLSDGDKTLWKRHGTSRVYLDLSFEIAKHPQAETQLLISLIELTILYLAETSGYATELIMQRHVFSLLVDTMGKRARRRRLRAKDGKSHRMP